MADQDRVVFPDEIEEIKKKVAETETVEKKEESNEIQTPEEPSLQMRNMIVAPSNCPPGYKMGADGVCREVF